MRKMGDRDIELGKGDTGHDRYSAVNIVFNEILFFRLYT